MWSAQGEELTKGRGSRFVLLLDSSPSTIADVIGAWQFDAAFPTWFNALLADSPYSVFRWETPAVTAATVDKQPFEFVLLSFVELANQLVNPKADDDVRMMRRARSGQDLAPPRRVRHDLLRWLASKYGVLSKFLKFGVRAGLGVTPWSTMHEKTCRLVRSLRNPYVECDTDA